MKKTIFIALSIISFFLCSCNNEVVFNGISIDKTALALPVNGTANIVATVQPVGAIGNIKWSSSNSAVATVVDGTVTGVSEGSAQIVATVGQYTTTCDVTISAAITSLSLNISSVSLKVDSTQTLIATFLPAQSAAVTSNLLWTSSNPTVATVNSSGKITAISDGTALVVASIGTVTAICSVTVYTTVANSLLGTNYYLLNVDASTVGILGSSKIAADFRPNNTTQNLYIWQGGITNTFNTGTCTGTNFYGNVDTWLSWVVGSVGWSGGAYNVKPGTELDKLKAVTDDTSGKYYLHFAIKSTTSNSYAFKLGYGASAVTIVFGTAAMESTSPYGNFTRNGQWQEIEIPMSYFKGKGLIYTTGMVETNIFAMLAGGTVGTKLEMDAVFIYKKP
jgi:uncharacterized protein YjdB